MLRMSRGLMPVHSKYAQLMFIMLAVLGLVLKALQAVAQDAGDFIWLPSYK